MSKKIMGIVLGVFLFVFAPSQFTQAQDAINQPIPALSKAETDQTKKKTPATNSSEEEAWKGTPYPSQSTLGLMGGFGFLNDNSTGFPILLNGALKILHEGFVPDINDQTWLEIAAGPFFMQGSAGFSYSVRLRWDFHMNYLWSFYTVGGLGGTATGSGLGSRFIIHPQVGLGAFLHLFEKVSFRCEFSHELVGLGISFMF